FINTQSFNKKRLRLAQKFKTGMGHKKFLMRLMHYVCSNCPPHNLWFVIDIMAFLGVGPSTH
ncbi:hypothetical protein EEO15_07125, partial [Staphylococcus pseudintermedius]|nr:hypothetical protein [Staphylococcus pseudintermedius]